MSKDVLDDAFETINKLYANGGVVNLATHRREAIKAELPYPSLQYVTDGGIPAGRLVYIGGVEHSGKSTLACQIADIISRKQILFCDTEYTTTSGWLENMGCRLEKWNHMMPYNMEQMFDRLKEHILTNKYDVVVIDSINNIANLEELSKTAEERSRSPLAHMLTTQLKQLVGICNQKGITLFVLAQLRVNQKKNGPYDPDYVFPNIMTLKHNATIQLELKPSTKQKSKDSDDMEKYDTISSRMTVVKCIKNKVGSPHRTVDLQLDFGSGFSVEADIANTAIKLGILEKSGSWIKYNGKSICQGQNKLTSLLQDNPELLEELLIKINNQ